MLDKHQMMRLQTIKGETIEVEVNYLKNKKVENCNIVKFKIGGKSYEILKDHLVSLMVVIGSVGDHKKLTPMTFSKVKKLERMLTFEIKLKHDHKAGEVLTVQAPWIDTIEDTQNILAGALKNKPRELNKLNKKESWKTGFVSGI